MDEQAAIIEAQCIVWIHQADSRIDEHPELRQECQAIIDAWTPAQHLEWIEVWNDIRQIIEEMKRRG